MICEKCNYKCDFQSLFDKHCLTSKHLEIVRPEFTCKECNYSCRFQSQYATHCKSNKHNKIEKKTYTCEKCKFSTPYKSIFDVHCSSIKHNDPNKTYACEKCEFSCSTKSTFEKHCLTDKHIENTTGIIQHNYKPTTNKIHVYHRKVNDLSFELIIKIRHDAIKTLTFLNIQQENKTFQEIAKGYLRTRYYGQVSKTNTSWFNEFYNLDEWCTLKYIIH